MRPIFRKFLLSNDDGIDAPGLAALERATSDLGECVVVAPAGAQSGMSHAITWERPVHLEQREAGRFAVHGTPADCTRLGLLRVAPDATWVLSGINHGGNLGADIYFSGTVAAVREAVLHGWPGIAFSQFLRPRTVTDWHRTSLWTTRVLAELLPRPTEPGLFYNVNFPQLKPGTPEPELIFCPLDPHPLPLSYRHEGSDHHLYNGDYQAREHKSGSDVDTCFSGDISVTALRLY